MLSLYFTTEELMNVTKLRNVDDYESMSIQELENIFKMLSVSISTLIPVSRARPRHKNNHIQSFLFQRLPKLFLHGFNLHQ